MANMINELLRTGNSIGNVSLPNPNQAMAVGMNNINSGFDKLQAVGQKIKQNRINSDIATALTTVDKSGSPETYLDSLFNAIGRVDGVDPVTAIGLASTLSKPVFDAREYQDGRVDANNLNSYRSTMAGKGSYGMTVDDMGNSWLLDKNTGEYKQVAEGSGYNPKNVVLKTITNRGPDGVEYTQQVPFNKLTGQPVDGNQSTGSNTGGNTGGMGVIKDYLATEYGITSMDQFEALPVNQQQAIEADLVNIQTPAVGGSNTGIGVKQPKPLDKTAVIGDGRTVYVDTAGKPIVGPSGDYIVKSESTGYQKNQESKKSALNTIGQLDDILANIKKYPDSVGSIGSDFGNWVGNQINDVLKVPTDTRLVRGRIDATSGVIASGLRKGVESGVMTDKDYDRYIKLVPNANDSPREATYKGNLLKDQLRNQFGIIPAGYKRQYNTQTGEYRLVPTGGQ